MTLTPSYPRLPFKFHKSQYPIIVSNVMIINKSLGQSLSIVGLFLKRPVFKHVQLYVVVSRVMSCQGLKIILCDSEEDDQNTTTNVVYKEIFQIS